MSLNEFDESRRHTWGGERRGERRGEEGKLLDRLTLMMRLQ